MIRTGLKFAIAIGVMSLALQAANAHAAPGYAVKFVCGTQRPNPDLNAPAEPPVKPGNYATVINVEGFDLRGGVKVGVSPAGAGKIFLSPGFILTQFQTVDITCVDIARAVGTSAGAFITGYVDIVPEGSVKVTAVYTSQGCTFLGSLRPVCSGQDGIDVVPQDLVTFHLAD